MTQIIDKSQISANGAITASFFVNPATISVDYTIPSNFNAMTAGPVTIANGVVVNVSSNSVWTIV